MGAQTYPLEWGCNPLCYFTPDHDDSISTRVCAWAVAAVSNNSSHHLPEHLYWGSLRKGLQNNHQNDDFLELGNCRPWGSSQNKALVIPRSWPGRCCLSPQTQRASKRPPFESSIRLFAVFSEINWLSFCRSKQQSAVLEWSRNISFTIVRNATWLKGAYTMLQLLQSMLFNFR